MRITSLLLLLGACKAPVTENPTDDTGVTPVPTGFCALLEVAETRPLCRESIRNEDVFDALDQDGVLWVLPVTSSIPTVVVETANTDLLGFLKAADPALADLQAEDLEDTVYGPDRHVSTGRMYRRADHVAFTFDEGADWAASYRDIDDGFDALMDLVHEDARNQVELVFEPTDAQADRIGGWRPNFPVEGIVTEPTYAAYTDVPVIGTVRILDRAAFEAGQESAQWGPEDILVLEDAEQDTERIVAGVISDEPLSAFGRVVERARNRGTAACFQEGVTTALAPHADERVTLTCGPTGITVTGATQEAATAFLDGLVGDPVDVLPADYTTVELQPLLTLDLADAAAIDGAIARYGLEATRLAIAYQQIPGSLQLRGLAVPVAFYQDFLERNTWITDLGDGPQAYTFRETLDAWFTDPAFLDEPAERRQRLEGLAISMRGAQVDPLLAERLNDAMPLVFGSSLSTLRVRGSVNLADQDVLPYADLLDGGSGCVADDLDGDFFGPSACEAVRPEERPIAVAVAEAYASLWTMASYEQRSFHGIDHAAVAMGLLVTDRVAGELADVVVRAPASSGTLVIGAQIGNLAAVGRASEHPELIEVTEASGRIVRRQASSEVGRGESVLTDAQITSLTAAVQDVRSASPGGEVVSEWKLLSNGAWALKHVQPVR